MQRPKLVDNATAGLKFQDSSTAAALDGTILRAGFQNDNFDNIFEVVLNAGYDLIDNNLEQLTKALRGEYVAGYTYNTSTILTQSVNDIVKGSDGLFYEAQADGIIGDDPVGSATGDWAEYYLTFKSPMLTGVPTAPTPATSTNTTQLATTAFVKAKSELDSVGVNQNWSDQVRSIGVTYTNTTGKPIVVSVSATASNANSVCGLIINGTTVFAGGTGTAGGATGFSLIVPNGHTYVTTVNIGTLSLVSWKELA